MFGSNRKQIRHGPALQEAMSSSSTGPDQSCSDVGDVSLVYEDAEWARQCRRALQDVPRPVKVLSPCAGLNSPERAARELGFPWQTAGDWDVNPALRTTLARLSKNPELLYMGPRSGDVLNVDINSLDLSTDALVAGPPCPPFSSIGKRLVELDWRSAVFVTICSWICHLAIRGQLKFWIIENVAGITTKRKCDDTSFAQWFVQEMYKDLPCGWEIRTVPHNSKNCLLPQSRPRVFFIGTAPCLRTTRRLQRILCQPPLSFPQVDILNFLDDVQSEGDYSSLSVKQQVNLLAQLEEFHRQCETVETEQVAIVDVARDPLKSAFDKTFAVGRTRTLRTNCTHLWILPSPRLARFGPKGRFLNRAEKARCAGLKPESLTDLNDAELCRAVGNTIPVSLIGTIMFPVLCAWSEYVLSAESSAEQDTPLASAGACK